MDSSINPGDVVTLLAGGPQMVVRVTSQHVAYCEWDEDGQAQRAPFEFAALVKWAATDPQERLLQAARQASGRR